MEPRASRPVPQSVRSQPMFAGLSGADREGLLRVFRQRRVPAGATLFKQGDFGDTLILVASGDLRVLVAGKTGAVAEVAVVGPTEVLGEMSCIDPAPRAATVVAVTDAVVYELTRDALHALAEHLPSVEAAVVSWVIRAVTRRLREVDALIESELAARAPGRASNAPRASSAPRASAPGPGGASPSARPSAPAGRSSSKPPPIEPARTGVLAGLLDKLRGLGG